MSAWRKSALNANKYRAVTLWLFFHIFLFFSNMTVFSLLKWSFFSLSLIYLQVIWCAVLFMNRPWWATFNQSKRIRSSTRKFQFHVAFRITDEGDILILTSTRKEQGELSIIVLAYQIIWGHVLLLRSLLNTFTGFILRFLNAIEHLTPGCFPVLILLDLPDISDTRHDTLIDCLELWVGSYMILNWFGRVRKEITLKMNLPGGTTHKICLLVS